MYLYIHSFIQLAGVTGSKLDLLQTFNNFNNFGSDSDEDSDISGTIQFIVILLLAQSLTYLLTRLLGVSTDDEYTPVKKSAPDIPLLKRIAEIKEKNKIRNR